MFAAIRFFTGETDFVAFSEKEFSDGGLTFSVTFSGLPETGCTAFTCFEL